MNHRVVTKVNDLCADDIMYCSETPGAVPVFPTPVSGARIYFWQSQDRLEWGRASGGLDLAVRGGFTLESRFRRRREGE